VSINGDDIKVLITGNAPDELCRFCISEILQAHDTDVVVFHTATMIDMLVEFGFFPSKGQARKNWKGPTEVEPGFHEFTIGKKNRALAIHKVVPETQRVHG
jgi:hypothetical protein